jgi:hypothetical protein
MLWSLVLLNVALGTTFVFRLFPDNTAHAQAAAARRPGDYIMIPAALGAGSAAIVYVLDSSTGQLSALNFDDPTSEINMMSSLDLSRVFTAGETVGGSDRRRK